MPQTIAENLQRVMAERDIDANALASRLGYANRATIDHWLSGRRLPTPDNIRRVAEVLEVPVEAIDPSGSAFKLAGRRKKSHGIDKTAEVGRMPYSQSPTTTAEGPMKDQIEAVVGALGLVDEDKRPAFVAKVKRLAASMVLGLEDAGAAPAKQKHVAGKG